MKRDWVLTKEAFDGLLAWLDADREQAGRRYEEVRSKLIKIFTSRGCLVPEDLADETIDRVISKLPELAARYVGDPRLYFYGVAQNVYLEYLRKKPVVPPPPDLAAVEPEESESEREYECLKKCMQRLPPDSRDLVLRYYREEKQAKISNRKLLAEQLGIALNTLRIRAFRIRVTLQKCMQDCMAQSGAG